MTRQKSLIYDIINKSSDHLTAEEVYRQAVDRMPGIVLATVYNNLNALVRDGLIIKLNLPDKNAHYDKTIPHDHMVCDRCGKIFDAFVSDKLCKDGFINTASSLSGQDIVSYELTLHCICKECQGKALN
ncbi:MAG: transcriptional repressor [Clostridia bacterium]|nr:transcriptional repressor [Clostridia bacterium]